MYPDLTQDLAKLLNFTADVATAIRMYSAYNRGARHVDAPSDLMWLSDSLHNFSMLSRAIQSRDASQTVFACDSLLRSYEHYEQELKNVVGQPIPAFARNSHRMNLQDARDVFLSVREKMALLTNKVGTERDSQ